MAEPTTAAGRAEVAHRDYLEIWHPVDGRRDECVASVLAIEAEAAAPYLDLIAAFATALEQSWPEDDPLLLRARALLRREVGE